MNISSNHLNPGSLRPRSNAFTRNITAMRSCENREVRNYGDVCKARALSLRERVAEGRVRVYSPSPALRAPSPGGRGPLPSLTSFSTLLQIGPISCPAEQTPKALLRLLAVESRAPKCSERVWGCLRRYRW